MAKMTPDDRTLQPPQNREDDIRKNKDMAAVGYLWILSIPIYMTRKDSPFIQYHSKQGIVLFLVSIPLWFIPVIGHLLELIVLVGMVIGFLNAIQGHYYDVPVIGALAKGEMTLTEACKLCWRACKNAFHAFVHTTKKSDSSSSSTTPSPHETV